MAGPQASSVFAMEVLVEKKVIPPVGIGLELLNISVHWPLPSLVPEEYALQASRDLSAHLKEIHQVS